VIETSDSSSGLQFKQVFRENMSRKSNPQVTKISGKEKDWTKVSFSPDLSKFGMVELDNDIMELFVKRVYDLAGCTHKSLKVFLNDQKIPIKDFKEYVNLYLPEGESIRIYESVNERWEVCVGISDGHFQQVSFVNSISTWKGGSHVKMVSDQICGSLIELIVKKHKNVKIKPHHVKNHLWVFINSLIENPAFDSQTKECLTSLPKSFGSSCALSENFMKNCK
jgi:DNA topoisomerase-2